MIRTQIQPTERQLDALRQRSAATGRSGAEIMRAALDLHLASIASVSPDEHVARAIQAAGRFRSGHRSVSVYDRHLASAFRR
jgi:hypothetical protein